MSKTQEPAYDENVGELIACVRFAINFLGKPPGQSGLVMHTAKDGKMTSESWLTWMRRTLKVYGLVWDDDMLEYGRASQKRRKEMLKDPQFARRLEENRASRKPPSLPKPGVVPAAGG